MAKLLTHHDRFHVHAALGLTALLHFLYRFGYHFLSLGRESFDPSEFSALALAVHVMLHATSFQFFLPSHRLWTKPMIWREFRVHNAIFAYRNLLCAALGIWLPVFWWRQPTLLSMMLKVGVVFATCAAADMATQAVGSVEKRTTNAMPYPSRTQKALEEMAKLFYAKSQFAATALAAFGPPVLSFCSILAIELASLLMTLVRKGIIESRTYHIVYAASLFIMFPSMFTTIHSEDSEARYAVFMAMLATAVACVCRLQLRLGKYVTWLASIASAPLLAAGVSLVLPIQLAAWIGAFWSASDTVLTYARSRGDDKAVVSHAKMTTEGGTKTTESDTVTTESDTVTAKSDS